MLVLKYVTLLEIISTYWIIKKFWSNNAPLRRARFSCIIESSLMHWWSNLYFNSCELYLLASFTCYLLRLSGHTSRFIRKILTHGFLTNYISKLECYVTTCTDAEMQYENNTPTRHILKRKKHRCLWLTCTWQEKDSWW